MIPVWLGCLHQKRRTRSSHGDTTRLTCSVLIDINSFITVRREDNLNDVWNARRTPSTGFVLNPKLSQLHRLLLTQWMALSDSNLRFYAYKEILLQSFAINIYTYLIPFTSKLCAFSTAIMHALFCFARMSHILIDLSVEHEANTEKSRSFKSMLSYQMLLLGSTGCLQQQLDVLCRSFGWHSNRCHLATNDEYFYCYLQSADFLRKCSVDIMEDNCLSYQV